MADFDTLGDRLKNLDRSEYDESALAAIDSWKSRLEELRARKEFSNNFIVKDLIASYQQKILDIDRILLEKRPLPELERERLLDQKAMYRDLTNSFDVTHSLQALEKAINENL